MILFSAQESFRRLRRRAAMEAVLARLRGESADLLSYEEVRRQLRATASSHVGLREIPLAAIVGSVGRYADFTRSFLPLRDRDQERWSRVKAAMSDSAGLPPIEVYQIGQAYFVRDGNHRVSVARQMGATHIQAYIIEIQTRVPLTPDVSPGELILKAEQTEFLERTGLDQVRRDADVTLTAAGQYERLKEHVDVHRYFMGLDQQRDISYGEAVAHWYDEVYLPVMEVIRERGLLRDLPGRTEADLYLWVADHRTALEQSLGWPIATGDAIGDLADQVRSRPSAVARIGGWLLDAVTPKPLEAGPAPGQWREAREARGEEGPLFADILVPVSGEDAAWAALDQAALMAVREGGRLLGLHVVPSEVDRQGGAALAVQAEFERRCRAAGAAGQLAIEVGPVARTICDRSRWADLVVAQLCFPPGPQPTDRLASGFRTLLLRCPRPVLAVPHCCSELSRGLLAYDGSPKAAEALYVAAYLAVSRGLSLTVVSAAENGRVTAETTAAAEGHLAALGVTATYLTTNAPAAPSILETAQAHNCDLILMGGYGLSPVAELLLGSTLDQVLRQSQWPVLICR